MPETDNWPFVEARWYTKMPTGTQRSVRVIVIHAMEFPEKINSAEVIAHDFATRSPGNKASAHLCIDSNSIVQCVWDRDVAFAAPGANSDGIQIELAGYSSQTREQWLDPFGQAMFTRAARACAQYCAKYNIPPKHLSNAELAQGLRGIVGHVQVSAVYHKSDHTDPGPNFPWDAFMALVNHFAPVPLSMPHA